jgi:hypothetical protein
MHLDAGKSLVRFVDDLTEDAATRRNRGIGGLDHGGDAIRNFRERDEIDAALRRCVLGSFLSIRVRTGLLSGAQEAQRQDTGDQRKSERPRTSK